MKKVFSLLVLFFLLISCQNTTTVNSKVTARTTQIDSLTKQDSLIIKEFLPYKTKMIAEINKVLSYTPKNITRNDGELQSSLGNLLADLCFEKSNEIFKRETGKIVDFSMFNHGGIRAGITKGEVKVINAFNLMPFENTLVVVELSYTKVKELFDYFINENIANPLSKNVQLTIKGNEYHVKIKGKPLDSSKTYFVATSNYLQSGGDRMNFFKDPVNLFESNFLMRNAIVDYFKSKDTLISNLDSRVIIR